MKCPKCGMSDFKTAYEQVTQTYKKCGNCGHAEALEKAEKLDAKEWVSQIAQAHEEAFRKFGEAKAKAEANPTNLTIALKNVAEREWKQLQDKMELADSVSTIVEGRESGQITLLLPGLGMFQFEWGDFNLFKVIGNEGR